MTKDENIPTNYRKDTWKGFCDAFFDLSCNIILLVVVQSKHSVVEAEQNWNLKEGIKKYNFKDGYFCK